MDSEDMNKRPGRMRKRGHRGHSVDPGALESVRDLLGDEPRRRDLLIEHLHRLQDHFGCLSAPHLVALAREMNLSPAEVFEVASFYHHFDIVRSGEPPPPALTVRVCDSISCQLAGAESLIESLQQALGDKVRVQRVPCVGRCATAPVAVVGQNPVEQADVDMIRETVERQDTRSPLPAAIGLDDYRKAGGYRLLQRLLEGEIDPESVIRQLEDSGLRGLGGAGFPAGRKWRIVRGFEAPRQLVVNIDEGEPGTFKDRHYLERDPHRLLEGALIAAATVGCEAIYLYVRDEYAGCRELLQRELSALAASPLSESMPLPPIHLRRGAGSYVCGEESALVESIEGKRGMPRLRPPYLAETGLFGRPTLEHNLETLYWVRDILEHGPAWFSKEGRHGRRGLRSFSVSGRVRRPGVYLAPAGITARELIDEYCGGMAEGHELYGYFPGGASGGILPASLADLPLDFDTLAPYGCFIGSAAVIVFSTQDSARNLALNAMRFFEHESCGQCTPCRVGTAKAVQLMEMGCQDHELIDELCSVMVDASICGLGQAAPNPLRCLIRYFPAELEEGNR